MEKNNNLKLVNNNLELMKLNKQIKSSDYLRIIKLYGKWWDSLINATLAYIVVYFFSLTCNSLIKNRKGMDLIYKVYSGFFVNSVFIFFVILKGILFCADGIISSWLKTPFGQICYAINKSGIDDETADEAVTIITEINEHFKETFKKFGMLSLGNDIKNLYNFIESVKKEFKKPEVEIDGVLAGIVISEKILMFWNISFLIPLLLAWTRTFDFKDKIAELEIVN